MGTTTETRITSTQAKDAIYKAHSISSSASEIDAVSKSLSFKKGNIVESFSSVEGWVVGGTGSGTISVVNEATPFGSSYMRAQTTITGGSLSLTKAVSSFTLMNSDYISLYVKNEGVSNFSNASLRLRNSSAKYFDFSFRTLLIGASTEEWHHIKIDISSLAKVGGVTLTDQITEINLTIFGTSGQLVDMKLGGIVIDNKERASISFTFDDANLTDYTKAYNKMKEYGFKGTSYIISSAVGVTNFLSLSQMQEMYDYGWKFGVHGTDSKNWVGESTLAQAEARIKGCRDFLFNSGLIGNGLKSTAYPQGMYNDDIIDILKKYGITHARTTIVQNNYFPIPSLYKIRGADFLDEDFEGNKLQIDNAMKRGGHICFIVHTIADGNMETVFNQTIDYIAENYSKHMTTLPDWVEAYNSSVI